MTKIKLSESTKKELSNFEDWIIATNNVSRLENGEISELHKEYVSDFHSFLDKIDKNQKVGNYELIYGTYGAKPEVAEKIYNTIRG